jgi:hypothetical protein
MRTFTFSVVRNLFPLSTVVMMVEKLSGKWCMTDGKRFSREHLSSDGVIADRESFRCLTFGEALPG